MPRRPLVAILLGIAVAWPLRVSAASGPATVPDDAGSQPETEPEPETETATEPAPGEGDPDWVDQEVRIKEWREHFNEGQALANEGRYLEAAAEFERSFVAIESGTTLRYLAKVYERGSRPVKALETARRWLALPMCEGKERIDEPCAKPDNREEVVAIARRARAQVGELTLDVPKGVQLSEVRIDGQPIAPEAFPLVLAPGTYEIELYGTERGQVRTRVVELDPGETEPLYVAPFSTPGATVSTTPIDPGPDPEQLRREAERRARRTKALKISFWSGLGLTVAAGATLTTFGVLTRRRVQQYADEQCPTNAQGMCIDPDWMDGLPTGRREDAREYRPITNAMIGVTAGLGVATVIVGIFAFSRREDRRVQRFGLGAQGLVVRW